MDSPPHGDSLYARGASESFDLTAWDSEHSVLLLKLTVGATPFQSCGACPATDYSGNLAVGFITWYACKSLRIHGGASGQRIAKPLYGQKLYLGFESLPLRQIQ
jgi:hypothetical protein